MSPIQNSTVTDFDLHTWCIGSIHVMYEHCIIGGHTQVRLIIAKVCVCVFKWLCPLCQCCPLSFCLHEDETVIMTAPINMLPFSKQWWMNSNIQYNWELLPGFFRFSFFPAELKLHWIMPTIKAFYTMLWPEGLNFYPWVKVLVHLAMKIMSLFTYPHVVPHA